MLLNANYIRYISVALADWYELSLGLLLNKLTKLPTQLKMQTRIALYVC